MLFHKMLDNSLFSVFLTSFLSHFETSQKKVIYIFKKKQIQREKKHIKVFYKKNQTIFLVRLLFSILIFFLYHQTSTILGSILQIIFIFFYFLVLFGKYVIYCRNNQVSIFYTVCTTELRKSRTLGQHCKRIKLETL